MSDNLIDPEVVDKFFDQVKVGDTVRFDVVNMRAMYDHRTFKVTKINEHISDVYQHYVVIQDLASTYTLNIKYCKEALSMLEKISKSSVLQYLRGIKEKKT